MLTKRYQQHTLRGAWEEVQDEMGLRNAPPDAIVLMRTLFLVGAVYVATHTKYSEQLLEEALEALDV